MRKNLFLFQCYLLSALVLAPFWSVAAQAAPSAAEITGEIERLTLNDPTDVYSGGVMLVAGTQVILPKNLLLDLPANRLSLQQLFDQAPAPCKANGESGLAKADRCNASGAGGFATLSGVHSTAGNVIAGDVLIEKGKETVSGTISFISYTDGYFRVNGAPGDPATGTMVRFNDPTGRHTVQQGLGCAGGPNCSADPRFTLDPDNYTVAFSSGFPVCIPSTVARGYTTLAGAAATAQSSGSGAGDALCPDTNRSAGALVEPPVNDSRFFAPLLVGDSVNAEGNYEAVNGMRFLSAHTMRVNKALSTKNLPDQPDYLFLEEVFMEAPGFQNQRARALIIGFTTLAPTDVDFWSLHRDPATNQIHEFPLASIQGCDIADGVGIGGGACSNQGLVGAGANIFRIRYDVDYLLAVNNSAKYPGGALARLNPCMHLMNSPRFALSNPGICANGVSLANNFGIMSPIPHEIQARTGHGLDHPGLRTLDLRGRDATNGQYLFPFGMNLGGIETADFLEIDVNLLATPRSFEGIPWNLDRRLSPSGCLKGAGCESTPQPLDPFPFTGLDPRTQADFIVAGQAGGTPKGNYSDGNFTASTLTNASNRVFSFVRGTPFSGGRYNFDGNNTLLPCASGLFPASCPPDPPLFAINPAPVFSVFAPVADEDAARTRGGVPVTINVLANDVPVLGQIDPASVKIVTQPASGTALANASGTITYTPPLGSTGTVTFAYTVANNLGGVSSPATVTVTITAPPVAVGDQVGVAAKSVVPIEVTTNDTADTSAINLASVQIVSPLAAGCGSVANQLNGTVLLTAPSAIPAGACSFSYVVSDIDVPPATSNVATVAITFTASNTPPVAVDDTATATAGSTITIPVLANDSSATSTLNAASLLLDAATGGTASANANGTVTYTAPTAGGTYYFAYTVQDSLSPPLTSNAALVSVTVTPVNVAPVAVNDTAATVVSTPVVVRVTANDTSATSTINAAGVTIVQQPAAGGGAAVANPNGTVTYTPGSLAGTYSFTYTVQDNFTPAATSNVATVTVTVAAANVAPVAQNDAAATTPGSTININVLGNDTSATSTLNPGSLALIQPAAGEGSAIANANGTVSYTAPAATGTFSFSYTVSDSFTPPATSNTALVTVTVTALSIPPVANNDAASTTSATPVTINVLANDTSAVSTLNPASVAIVTPPANGTALVNGTTGAVTYTSAAGFVGTVTFTYTVRDNSASPATSNAATVSVTVIAPSAPPTAVNDTGSTATNTQVTINVLGNDTAGTSAINAASVAVVNPPANGTAVANLAGTVTYTPALGFSGTDSFSYTVKDSTGLTSNSATVSVTVTAPASESISVTRAQFTLNGASWRVDGTVTPPANGESLKIYNSSTVPADGATGLLATVGVAANGAFTWSSPKGAPAPNATRRISVQSSLGTKVEGVTVIVR